MSAIVHGWCGFVEKANDVVCQQMVLNKLWIPDVLIDIIKDYLYVSASEVLRKFYRLWLNRSITDIWTSNQVMVDVYNRERLVLWQTGYIYGGEDLHLQGAICTTCGSCSQSHNNINGFCALVWDGQEDGEPMYLEEQYPFRVAEEAIELENEEEAIPEVGWAVDVPSSGGSTEVSDDELRQTVLDNLAHRQAFEDARNEWWGGGGEEEEDVESWAYDYAEEQREQRLEEYSSRR